MLKIAVIGDIHKLWNDADVDFFNGSDYHAVLIVGDLPGRTNSGWDRMLRGLSRLRRPSFFIPGNHDGVSVMQKFAELKQDRAWIESSSHGQVARCMEMERKIAPVQVCGYSIHSLSGGGETIDLVAVRPHTMGGPFLGYAPYLRARFGVETMEESAARIVGLLEQCHRPTLILAHNGPTGLGDRASDIWGCDFRAEEGDFGDPDLEWAIQKRPRNLKLLGVVAGHMHLALRGRRGQRRWYVEREGLQYANAARVPRIYRDESGKEAHHHLHLEIASGVMQIAEARVVGGELTLRPASA